jgi:hypothetical protein
MCKPTTQCRRWGRPPGLGQAYPYSCCSFLLLLGVWKIVLRLIKCPTQLIEEWKVEAQATHFIDRPSPHRQDDRKRSHVSPATSRNDTSALLGKRSWPERRTADNNSLRPSSYLTAPSPSMPLR